MDGRRTPRAAGIGSLASYECLDQVGEGTYGYVYKARDRRTSEIVALKRLILNKEMTGFPLCAVREIKFLKALKHKNVVLLKDVVTSKGCEHTELPVKPRVPQTEKEREKAAAAAAEAAARDQDGKDVLRLCGNLYFVFEFIEHDLGGLIDSKYKFPPRAIKSIMKQLFEVLDFLNEKKIVHRDIKSSNILITTRHEVKLADFGLARSLQSGDGRDLKIDMTNNVITLWYRPPELLLGAVRYSSAVDIWSAGCVLAELELSRPIFPGKSEADQLELICKTIGTLTEDSFPGVSKLPHYEAMLKSLPKYVNNMKALYQGRISAHAEGLLERILVPDPLRRSSAKIALTNKYFHAAPAVPSDPLELEPMNLADGSSFHEYKTKMLKKQSQEETKRLAEAGASSAQSDNTPAAYGPAPPTAPFTTVAPPLSTGAAFPPPPFFSPLVPAPAPLGGGYYGSWSSSTSYGPPPAYQLPPPPPPPSHPPPAHSSSSSQHYNGQRDRPQRDHSRGADGHRELPGNGQAGRGGGRLPWEGRGQGRDGRWHPPPSHQPPPMPPLDGAGPGAYGMPPPPIMPYPLVPPPPPPPGPGPAFARFDPGAATQSHPVVLLGNHGSHGRKRPFDHSSRPL